MALAGSLLVPGLVFAYVGPGAGIGLLGALWGLIVGVILALGIILIWPIRFMLKKRRAQAASANADAADDTVQQQTDDNQAAAQTDKA